MRHLNERTFRVAVALLGAMAAVLSVIMMVHSLSGSHLIGCNPGSSCDSVLGSGWSLLLGFLPVSALAAGMYLAVSLCALMLSEMPDFKWLLVFAACAMLPASLWFIWVMEFKLHAICPYCMATHAVSISMCILVLMHYRDDFKASRKLAALSAGAGVASAIVLAGIQLATTPTSRYEMGTSDQPLPVPQADMDVPVIGDPDADVVFELMFDYMCNHCQKIHHWLKEIIEEGTLSSVPGQSVAVILCPTPLSNACNHYLPPVDVDRFLGSCDLAKMALALWKLDKESFREFDEWLFSAESGKKWSPRTADEARVKAAMILSERSSDIDIDTAVADPWVDAYLSMSLELFGRTTNDKSTGIPRIVHGSSWIIPEADSKEDLVSLLRENFGL